MPLSVPLVPLENFNTSRLQRIFRKALSLKVVLHLAGRLGLCGAELRCFFFFFKSTLSVTSLGFR